jgi:thiamine biosynthesis lipoprotein
MKILGWLLFPVLMSSCGEREENVRYVISGKSMGSSWKLGCTAKAGTDLRFEVQSELDQWEQVLSQWREGSDLSRYNRGEAASAELQRVLDLAEEIRQASGGAFDHRILREVHAAGFGPAGKGVDLSAIGKGFAVDRVGDRLKALGITDFIFELGGEVLVGEGKWKVGVELPDQATSEILYTLELRGEAMATSGNYRQFKPDPDGLAAHIIDPRNGKPVVREPCSVTVVAGDCATADAWATALFVLGSQHPTPQGLEVRWNWLSL